MCIYMLGEIIKSKKLEGGEKKKKRKTEEGTFRNKIAEEQFFFFFGSKSQKGVNCFQKINRTKRTCSFSIVRMSVKARILHV